MVSGLQRGNRCDICTGCGRCVHGRDGVEVITDRFQERKWEQGLLSLTGKFIAVDIGTTTIAMVLYGDGGKELDRFVTVNPQTLYGADVLSRIQKAETPCVSKEMQEAVLQVLEQGIEHFRKVINKEEQLLSMVIAANTTMIYLLMGWKTEELGKAPFHASHLEEICTEVCGIKTVIISGLSAFVGADVMSGIYACEMAENKAVTLFIDLGTNGEMVLGNSEKMIACATAAGPAFEGGATRGIWGADIVSLTATLLENGVLDETGLLTDPYFEDGILVGNTLVSQQDIRGLQMAKGAIAAGIQVLINHFGLSGPVEIDQVILAGGFGYYLKAEDASRIGLFPKELESKVKTGGNTALGGTLRLGMNLHKGDKKEEIQNYFQYIKKITSVINLAEVDDFEQFYIELMNLSQ